MFDLLDRLLLRDMNTGPRGERAAARFLRKAGYRVLARNLRSPMGEIDLLAQAPDGKTIVVIEVKAARREADRTPRPEVHVNAAKQRKLTALAMQLVKTHRLQNRPVRFDVIGVDFPEKGPPVIRHHVHAFEAAF